MRTFNIQPTDKSMEAAIQQKIDNLNKPKGSLGRLEELAMQICLVQQALTPSLAHPCHLLLGADHGIEREGVSVSPREVTWQQMINFTRGGGGVNMFCRQHGFTLRIVDVGVDYDFAEHFSHPSPTTHHPSPNTQHPSPNTQHPSPTTQHPTPNTQHPTPITQHPSPILDRKIARGTKNFLYEPAMSEDEFNRTIQVGVDLVNDCVAEGCRVLCLGEMGIGNTSPSSIWMHLLANIPLEQCVGAGAGLNTPGIRHKYEVLSKAVEHYHQWEQSHPSPNTQHPSPTTHHPSPLRYFGGFEMVAAIGAMLRAAEQHLMILIDGFIMSACALAAVRLYPAVQEYMIFTHCGDESGHKLMLDALQAKPLLHLGLRLGEGTGALCAFPIIDSAVRMVNEMNNFQSAKITKYF